MSLCYKAAEYFIETLRNSTIFCISYDDVKVLLHQASQDVQSYLFKESPNDFLFIFRKFPDVFVFHGNTITLTDAFLSLYAFPGSTEFSTHHNCENIFETFAVEYFKLIMARCGTCHFVTLFDVLSQNELQLPKYFSNYNRSAMYSFFLKHSNFFTMLNHNVTLNLTPLLSVKTVDQRISTEKACLKLAEATNFLLNCFDSLHYIELRQCISFVFPNLKQFLNMHTLLQQREIFENLQDTSMDEMGFLSLKTFDSVVPRSHEVRLIVLIVVILAFEEVMHFQKIVHEVRKRASSKVRASLCDVPTSEQLKFFKNYSDFFVVYDQFYVTLVPSFVFPICNFEKSLPNQYSYITRLLQSSGSNCQNNTQTMQTAIHQNITPQNSITSHEKYVQSSQADNLLTNTHSSYSYINGTNYIQNGIYPYNISEGHLKDSHNLLNLRMKHSMTHLLGYSKYLLRTLKYENILKSCFYVLKDVQSAFFVLKLAEQGRYIAECCEILNNLSIEGLSPGLASLHYINDKEQALMLIVYVLIDENGMPFENLSRLVNVSTVGSKIQLLSALDQLVYFREMIDYLTVDTIGYVCLNKTFDDVSALVNLHFLPKKSLQPVSSILPKKETKDSLKPIIILAAANHNSITSTVKNATIESRITSVTLEPVLVSNISSKESNASLTKSSINLTAANHSTVLNALDSDIIESGIPPVFYKKLQHSALLLHNNNCINSLVFKHILEVVLHSLNELKHYFSYLSTPQQYKFVECFCKSINNEFFLEILPENGNLKDLNLSEDEKALLYITHLLIKEKSFHFEKIGRELLKLKITSVFSCSNVSRQFKNFRGAHDYLEINSNGYVSLCSSFFSLRSIINTASAQSLQTQKKMESKVRIKILTENVNRYGNNLSVEENSNVDTAKHNVPSKSENLNSPTNTSSGIIVANQNALNSVGNAIGETGIPSKLYKKLQHSVIFLQKCFDYLVARDILKAFLHTFNDEKTYFSSLSTLQQYKFVESFCQNINSESFFEVSENSRLSTINLTEEEKALLYITYLLIVENNFRYEKIVQKLKELKIICSLCCLSVSGQFKHFKTLFEYFVINESGYVSLNASFSLLSSIISSVSELSMQIQEKMESKVKIKIHKNKITNHLMDSISVEIRNDGFSKRNVMLNDLNVNPSLDISSVNVIDMIIDISVSVLSFCERMKIEKLCDHLNSSGVKCVQSFFCFYTGSEKTKFYANIPQYFEVTQEGIIRLKKDVILSYVPKTSLIARDRKDRFILQDAEVVKYSCRPESANSGYVTDTSESPCASNSSGNKSKKRKPRLKAPNNPFYATRRKVTTQALSNLKDLLSSGDSKPQNASKATQENYDISKYTESTVPNGWRISCSEATSAISSKNSRPKFISTIGRTITKHQTPTNTLIPDKDLQSNMISNIEFRVPCEPAENKSFPKGNECLLRNGKITNNDLKNSTAALKSCDILLLSDIKKETVLTNEILSKNSLKDSGNIEKFQKDNSSSKHITNNSDYKDLDPYTSYGIELLSSFLGELELDTRNNSGYAESPSLLKVHKNVFIVNDKKTIKNCPVNEKKSSSEVPNSTQNGYFAMETQRGSPFCVKSSSDSNFDVELQAVNFFSTILLNYKTGVSARFLMKHLNLASFEVQTFMFNFYKTDYFSFFLKHRKAFYVSPETKNIYAVK